MRPPTRAARGSSGRTGGAQVWVPLLASFLLAGLLGNNLQREDGLRAEIIRSYDARARLQNLFTLLQDAQTAARGVSPSGRADVAPAYTAARQRLPGELRQLEPALIRSAAQRRRFTHLEQLVAVQLDDMARLVAARARQAPRAPLAPGGTLMGEIRTEVAQLDAAEAHELAKRKEAQIAARRDVNVLGGLTVAALLGASLLAEWRERRQQQQRADLLAALSDKAGRLSAVFDNAMDGVLTLTPDGRVDSVNPAAARMFGYEPDELLGRDGSILSAGGLPRYQAFFERLNAGYAELESGLVREVEARRRDGSVFPINVALSTMRLPDGPYLVAVLRDISERRRGEAMQKEFVSTVSHELRTPLSSIAGALGLLKAGAAGVLPDQAARLVQIAETNSARLVRLINNILDIERFASGHAAFEPTPQPANDLAQRAAEAMSGLAHERGVRLAVFPDPGEPMVSGEADRLLQVLTNLLSNAVKFSPEGAVVEIAARAEGDRAAFLVTDHGPGVPEAFLPRLFDKFAQADGSDARSHGGSGLGLAIAREIALLHGGRLEHAATSGGGATFRFELPLLRLAGPSGDLGPPRVLICEDDLLTADLLRHELEADGFVADVTSSANEARLALHTNAYAVMLLDLGLPDADGLTLVRALRAAPATRDVPVIVMSGTPDWEGAARQLDILDWLDKPLNLRRLRLALSTVPARRPHEAPMILHVDDDPDLLEVARGVLGGAGEVVHARSLAAARRIVSERRPDVVVLDLGLPDGSGEELIPELVTEAGAPIPVVIYTAQEPERELEGRIVSVFTKSRTGMQPLADAVRSVTEARAQARAR